MNVMNVMRKGFWLKSFDTLMMTHCIVEIIIIKVQA